MTDITKFMTPAEKSINAAAKKARLKTEAWNRVNELIKYYKQINKNDETICKHCGITQEELDNRVREMWLDR